MTSKQALQDLRWNVSMSQDLNYKENNDLCDIIEKGIEVLTILHDKEVALECVKATDNYKDYIRAVQRIYGNVNIDITEREYNLLKGWLENDK